ncbi:hypothetical protein MWH28_04655 [Natroniella sulfidigena]|uniref:hypothetical protein n=1 Tax=Natroniella sulfidigena TaxID=723921 RepID=UPI00200AFCDF|nr:hypothetical protein [Natroniella sulfidigena]MCK8816661.1 hypothetical protein [Natroniella sulfidigena]
MLANKKLIIIVLTGFLLVLVGCGEEGDNENNPDENLPPDSLLEISTTSEGIIDELEGIYSQIEERREEEELKLERRRQSREVDLNQPDQETDNESDEEEQNQLPEEEEQLTEELQESWDELEGEVEALHQNWNEYESEVNLKPEQIGKIEAELNQLTEEIADKFYLVALLSTAQFDSEVAKLYRRYDVEGEAELKEAMATTRKIIFLNRLELDEHQLKEEQQIALERLKDLHFEIDQSMEGEEEKEEEVKRLEEAIADLETAIKMSENDEVIEVKGELVLSRLEELED